MHALGEQFVSIVFYLDKQRFYFNTGLSVEVSMIRIFWVLDTGLISNIQMSMTMTTRFFLIVIENAFWLEMETFDC